MKTRRQFIKSSLAATAAFGLPAILPSGILRAANGQATPSNQLSVAVLGCGRIARVQARYRGDARVTTVCDVRPDNRAAAVKKFGEVALYTDFREMLDKADIDLVHIAAPDHWHVPMAITCARVGKHILLEKPMGNCVDSNRRLMEVIDETGVTFQFGSEQRFNGRAHQFLKLLTGGYVGEVREILVWSESCRHPNPEKPTHQPETQPLPEGLDWEMWLGPAPLEPYADARCKTPASVFDRYAISVGFINNLTIHMNNLVQWWADTVGAGAPVAWEGEGKWLPDSFYDTLYRWDAEAHFANGVKLRHLSLDVARERGVPGVKPEGDRDSGITVIGEKGRLTYHNGQELSSDRDDYRALMRMTPDSPFTAPDSRANECADLVSAVRNGHPTVCDLRSSFDSDLYGILPDIAIRTASKVEWDAAALSIRGTEAAVKMSRRELRQPWMNLVYA